MPAEAAQPAATLMPIDEAVARVLGQVIPLPAQTVAVDQALGRVLAAAVVAADDVPPFASSAMDGYAVRAGPAGRTLRVIGESRAGVPSPRPLAAGEAIRVSTGAAIPAGATAVIAQEDADRDGDALILRGPVADGAHVRGAGEDMRAGTAVLEAGRRVGALELAAAIAAGAGTLAVATRPRVAVLCTGDELRPAGAPLRPGEIHDSNGPMLTGLALAAGAAAGPARRLADDRRATVDGIGAALRGADVVILSGGVSVGPHDHVKPALAANGVEQVFWSVKLQPGKPTWFGVHGGRTLVFGLPGNPVSTAVTFALFVAPALAALQGAAPPAPPLAQASLAVDMPRNPRRDQAVRVALRRAPGGATALPTGAQGSHILSSLLEADALALIPAGEGSLRAGAVVSLRALAH